MKAEFKKILMDKLDVVLKGKGFFSSKYGCVYIRNFSEVWQRIYVSHYADSSYRVSVALRFDDYMPSEQVAADRRLQADTMGGDVLISLSPNGVFEGGYAWDFSTLENAKRSAESIVECICVQALPILEKNKNAEQLRKSMEDYWSIDARNTICRGLVDKLKKYDYILGGVGAEEFLWKKNGDVSVALYPGNPGVSGFYNLSVTFWSPKILNLDSKCLEPPKNYPGLGFDQIGPTGKIEDGLKTLWWLDDYGGLIGMAEAMAECVASDDFNNWLAEYRTFDAIMNRFEILVDPMLRSILLRSFEEEAESIAINNGLSNN